MSSFEDFMIDEVTKQDQELRETVALLNKYRLAVSEINPKASNDDDLLNTLAIIKRSTS